MIFSTSLWVTKVNMCGLWIRTDRRRKEIDWLGQNTAYVQVSILAFEI